MSTSELPQGASLITDDQISEAQGHVLSTSDERTINNAVRHQYRVLSDTEKEQMQAIKDQGQHLINLISGLGESRELLLARTKAEESVMWAVKHITA